MLTKPTAQALWSKLAQGSGEWLRSQEGRCLQAKALLLVRAKDGRAEARQLAGLLLLARTMP
jgi:hypothetical protein